MTHTPATETGHANRPGSTPPEVKLSEVSPDVTEKDREKIRASSVREFCSKTQFLKDDAASEKPEGRLTNVKEETDRRIQAYTTRSDKCWYTLDYKQFGVDAEGNSHEQSIGLGDILLDPEITTLLVRRQGSETPIMMAHRGIWKGERVAFLDEKGRYVATHTGDQFKIVPKAPRETEGDTPVRRAQQLELETGVRERTPATQPMEQADLPERAAAGTEDFDDPPLDEQGIARQLEQHLPPGEGLKVMDYSRRVCAQFDIPLDTLWATAWFESRYNPDAVNPASNATGLGQFLASTWKDFMAYCKKHSIHDPEWGAGPLTLDSRRNPYVSVYAMAWLIRQNEQSLGGLADLPVGERTAFNYLAFHEGAAGARAVFRFLRALEPEGCSDLRSIIEFQRAHAEEFDRIAKSTLTGEQYVRLNREGVMAPNSFLMAHFRYSARVGALAAAGTLGAGGPVRPVRPGRQAMA